MRFVLIALLLFAPVAVPAALAAEPAASPPTATEMAAAIQTSQRDRTVAVARQMAERVGTEVVQPVYEVERVTVHDCQPMGVDWMCDVTVIDVDAAGREAWRARLRFLDMSGSWVMRME